MSDIEDDINLNQLESTFLSQIRNASIFWFVALNIFRYPKLRDVVYFVLGLTILLFVIALVDYAQQRSVIMDRRIEVPYRFDIIWAATLVATLVVIWMMFKFWRGECAETY